jgi:hypothetical protein
MSKLRLGEAAQGAAGVPKFAVDAAIERLEQLRYSMKKYGQHHIVKKIDELLVIMKDYK